VGLPDLRLAFDSQRLPSTVTLGREAVELTDPPKSCHVRHSARVGLTEIAVKCRSRVGKLWVFLTSEAVVRDSARTGLPAQSQHVSIDSFGFPGYTESRVQKEGSPLEIPGRVETLKPTARMILDMLDTVRV